MWNSCDHHVVRKRRTLGPSVCYFKFPSFHFLNTVARLGIYRSYVKCSPCSAFNRSLSVHFLAVEWKKHRNSTSSVCFLLNLYLKKNLLKRSSYTFIRSWLVFLFWTVCPSSPSWPWTQGPYASTSGVLGLHMYITMPDKLLNC